ncbi:MAG: peptidoglycan-binding protein [Lyngbya sp. HA4199-MV5]|jgi:peptidoglycan hydrolase-like protein with peptidoglycan-binding domain|nr:peptidoglycan-binding protein [Lyngbya sp. HA4199-MV5]
METFAYLHTACAYEDPAAAELALPFDHLSVKQLSGQASLLMLQLLVPAAILAVAGHASALQVGDRGAAVRTLQDQLRQAGYFQRSSTGIYKSITENAVKRFQKDRGLRVDGIAGPETQRALTGQVSATSENILPISSNSNSTIFSSTTINGVSSVSTFQSSTITTGRLLRLGSRGSDVQDLQQQLNVNGYSVQVDGIFGNETDNAVRRFQRQKGLYPDGVVGSDTRYALGLSPDPGGNGSSASIRKRYVVVVPIKDTTTLNKVKLYAPGASIGGRSNLGKYVDAGASDKRGLAEAEATRLRALGFDAQVRYF